VFSGTALIVAMALAQVILGVALAPTFPVSTGVFESWFPITRWGFVNGFSSSAMHVGTAITGPLIVALTASLGWQEALLWTAVPVAVLTGCWAWYGRDRPRDHPSVSAEEIAELGETCKEPAPPATLQRFMQLIWNRNITMLAVSYLCMNYAFYLLMTAPFLYLVQERHLSQVRSGWLAMLPPAGAAMGAWFGGELMDRLVARFGPRWGHRLIPMISLPGTAVLLLVAVRAEGAYVAIACFLLAYALVELNEGPYWAATMQVARADTMAATGVLNTGGNLGGVVCYPILGYLSGHGAWNAAFAIGAGFSIVAAALWLLVSTDQRIAPD
jgi:ACS family glucarate transporter-like MFS transporter